MQALYHPKIFFWLKKYHLKSILEVYRSFSSLTYLSNPSWPHLKFLFEFQWESFRQHGHSESAWFWHRGSLGYNRRLISQRFDLISQSFKCSLQIRVLRLQSIRPIIVLSLPWLLVWHNSFLEFLVISSLTFHFATAIQPHYPLLEQIKQLN